MIEFETCVLRVEKPTLNNRIYGKFVCEGIVESINNGDIPVVGVDGFVLNSDGFDIKEPIGLCTGARITDDGDIMVTIQIDESQYKRLNLYTPSGIGVIDKNLTISDYELKFIQVDEVDDNE